jgi:hypothetical protein
MEGFTALLIVGGIFFWVLLAAFAFFVFISIMT